MCLNITKGEFMKIAPVKANINKTKATLLGSVAATMLAISPLVSIKAQKADSLELKKDTVELCKVPQNETYIKDDASEFEKASKAFVIELLAALGVVGIGLLGAWEPKGKNPKS